MSSNLSQPARSTSILALERSPGGRAAAARCERKRERSSWLTSTSLRLQDLIARSERCGAYLSVETETQFGSATSHSDHPPRLPAGLGLGIATSGTPRFSQEARLAQQEACAAAVTDGTSLGHHPPRGQQRKGKRGVLVLAEARAADRPRAEGARGCLGRSITRRRRSGRAAPCPLSRILRPLASQLVLAFDYDSLRVLGSSDGARHVDCSCLSEKAPAGNCKRGPHFSHSPSHISTPGRPCFYLAIPIGPVLGSL